jgi:4-carboxymuconolactone decarboxylase
MTGDNPDRMPPIPAERMSEAQRAAVAEIVAGARGALYGPFIPLLRSPDFMGRLQKTGEYLRFCSVLPKRVSEFIILMVARHYTQQFEWAVHQPIALEAGVGPEIAQAIAEGRRPDGMAESEAAVHDFVTELHLTQSVSDPAYARVLAEFGEQGVIDIIGIVGYYALLAMVMNVARTPPGESSTPPLPKLPR